MVSRRRGFTLAEVIVAMTLLSICTLAVAATGLVAARAFTQAEIQERVLREAESILDSLAAGPTNSAGTRELAGARLSWTATDSSSAVVMRVKIPNQPPFEIRAMR
ncbi:MAG TPA: prepilin-type N-terminal cleavage/methylation domain-containing protein [Longimicrobiales bacterium]